MRWSFRRVLALRLRRDLTFKTTCSVVKAVKRRGLRKLDLICAVPIFSTLVFLVLYAKLRRIGRKIDNLLYLCRKL